MRMEEWCVTDCGQLDWQQRCQLSWASYCVPHHKRPRDESFAGDSSQLPTALGYDHWPIPSASSSAEISGSRENHVEHQAPELSQADQRVIGSACSCPSYMDMWWGEINTRVLLVHIGSVLLTKVGWSILIKPCHMVWPITWKRLYTNVLEKDIILPSNIIPLLDIFLSYQTLDIISCRASNNETWWLIYVSTLIQHIMQRRRS